MRHGPAEDAAHARDDVLDGIRRARAEIIKEGLSGLAQLRQYVEMSAGKVVDVHVIPQTGAIRRRIIRAEDLQGRATAQCGGDGQRDQVGLRRMVLADRPIGRSPGGIEVTEGGEAQPVRAGEFAQTSFDREFGGAVRIDGALRQVFRHRHLLRDAVGCAGAREDEFLDALREHRLKQSFRPDDVVLVVTLGLLDGFADVRESREIDHHLGAGLLQSGANGRLVTHVGAEEPHPGRNRLRMTVGQVVEHGHHVPGGHGLPDAMAADVAGTAHYEHVHDGR